MCSSDLSGAVNTKLYAMSNTVAAPTVQVWDLATTPTVAGLQTNAMSSLTGGYSIATYGVTVLTYLSMPSWAGFLGGAGADPVSFVTGSVGVPSGLTAWSPGTLQTTSNTYFTRDVQQVDTFTVSAIGTGITANATYTVSGVTFTFASAYSIGATSLLGSTTSSLPIPEIGRAHV